MPLVILRPSIIGAAWKEPIGGWIDTVSAAGVIYMATGVGLLKMLQGTVLCLFVFLFVSLISSVR